MIWLAIALSSPLTRLRFSGAALDQRFVAGKPTDYLVGIQTEIRTHSEAQGRVDTPFPLTGIEEVGYLTGHPSMDGSRVVMTLKSDQWIRTQITDDHRVTTSLPKNHPSLAARSVVLDKSGHVVGRPEVNSIRIGRCIPFAFPSLPKQTFRRGTRWDEPIEWLESLGDWKLLWRGTLQWQVADYEDCYGDACVRLTYRAAVKPQLWAAPEWAGNGIRQVRFSGDSTGEALYFCKEHRFIANTLTQSGVLSFPIDMITRIPWELRVGRPIGPLPGTIVLQFKNRLDIRKP